MSLQATYASCLETRLDTGFRSALELKTARALAAARVPYRYEAGRIPFNRPSHYLPDFILEGQAIVIETKGYFPSGDRGKMLLIKAAHPDLDIRLLFSNPDTRIGKGSKTTYGLWCHKQGFPFAKGPEPPQEWLAHRPSPAQLAAFKAVFNHAA